VTVAAEVDRRRREFAERFGAPLIRLASSELFEREGILRQVVGLTLEATGLRQPLGGRCRLRAADGR
jgi:flagellum-specific ATP synthase